MEHMDSIHLLKECDAGTKMAVASIDEVLDKLAEGRLKETLLRSREHHEKLGNELHELLLKKGSEEKEPNPMAKSMSWLKTNMKISMTEDSEKTIADLMTEGCDMGIKSLHKYKNQYKNADHTSRDICDRLIDIEEELREEMKVFL